MKLRISILSILCLFLFSCNDNSSKSEPQVTSPTFQNQGHELVYNMIQKVGDYSKLNDKKDVIYTYRYETPDGQADVTTEKYIFDGELSYGLYNQHERTFPDLEGPFEQGYDGSKYWLKHDGKVLTDEARLKRVAFSRPTNYYWFAMMQKLNDDGLSYEYLGERTMNKRAYDAVKVSFNSKPEKPTDIYQLYINKNTGLVDQFLFTVADFGVMETPFIMQVEYEQVDDILIPTKRKYKKSTWEADVTEDPWINVTWSDIKFNNGLNESDFKS